jgi:MraZ protein
VTERALFRGRGLQGIDAKGRVGIPAGLRATIERNAGERILLLAPHSEAPCLVGYDRAWSDLLQFELDRDEERALAAGRPTDRLTVARRAFGSVEDIPFDASGRFILPAFPRQKAKLGDVAMFIGTGKTFEIWNPHVLLDHSAIDADTKEMVAFDLAQRGAG